MIGPYAPKWWGSFDEIARPEWAGEGRWQSEFGELTVEVESRPDQLTALTLSVWSRDGDELDNERGGQLLVRAAELPEFAARLRELTGRADRKSRA
jgi:hypothetical protein